MIGLIFGKLKVLEFSGISKDNQKIYLCECECGNKKNVISGNLKKGNTKSCGCLQKKIRTQRMSALNFRHGETNTKLWKTWRGIVLRTTCQTDSHYPKYGGNGIGIDPDWLIYENFANYIGQPPSSKHSVDRINNKKGYEPNNVRWATAKEQASNRNNNVKVLINGIPMILSDAAKFLNISKSSASRWYKQGKLIHYYE